MKKNLTLISLNFYPEDTAIGLYSYHTAKELCDEYNVSVVTGFPYYPQWEISAAYKNKELFVKEMIDEISVFRCKQYVPKHPSFVKRLIHLNSFVLLSLYSILQLKKQDVVVVVLPYFGAIFLGMLLKVFHRSKLVIHIQDFEFDAATHSGLLGNFGVIRSMFSTIERFCYNQANSLTTISHAMLQSLQSRTCKSCFLFPNFYFRAEKEIPSEIPIFPDKFTILYSGNIGNKQDWNMYIKLVQHFQNDTNKEFILVGDGSMKDYVLSELNKYRSVRYFPPVPYDSLSHLLESVSLHILFQKEDVVDSVMPSKLINILHSGIPVVVSGNPDSEVRKVITDSKSGLYCSNELHDIATSVQQYCDAYFDTKKEYKTQGKEYVTQHFEIKAVMHNFKQILNALFK